MCTSHITRSVCALNKDRRSEFTVYLNAVQSRPNLQELRRTPTIRDKNTSAFGGRREISAYRDNIMGPSSRRHNFIISLRPTCQANPIPFIEKLLTGM